MALSQLAAASVGSECGSNTGLANLMKQFNQDKTLQQVRREKTYCAVTFKALYLTFFYF
jgi:hypothetical protein